MSIIYLPIETSKRELVSKTFLATKLASLGHQVIVFESSLFDQAGWFYPGIYIGKNCFRTEVPYSLKYYNQMKDSNVDVWYLDEEGGIYNTFDQSYWSDMLKNRINSSDLDCQDKIFSWGLWQADDYKHKDLRAPIHITGSPNFDILQKKYNDSLSAYDLSQTDDEKNYILINTRFSSSNGLRPMKWAVSSNTAMAQSIQKTTLVDVVIEEGIMQYNLAGLTKKLAEEMPLEKFIIRPHPAEDPSFYQTLFGDLPNVKIISHGDVRSWIRNSKLLIHNGCTTAIQADIAEKKVITYIPEGSIDYERPGLPNSVGTICSNFSEVLSLINNSHYEPRKKKWSNTISQLDSINSIAEIVKDNLNPADRINDLYRSLNRKLIPYKLQRNIRDNLRFLLRKKYNEYKINQQKLDPSYFLKSSEIFKSARHFYDARVAIKSSPSKLNYFIVEPD